MGVSSAIITAALAAGGTAYSISSSNKAREEARTQADKTAKTQEENLQRQKDQEQANQVAKQNQTIAATKDLESKNAQGYRSTIGTTPSGLTGIAVTGGQKTLLGG